MNTLSRAYCRTGGCAAFMVCYALVNSTVMAATPWGVAVNSVRAWKTRRQQNERALTELHRRATEAVAEFNTLHRRLSTTANSGSHPSLQALAEPLAALKRTLSHTGQQITALREATQQLDRDYSQAIRALDQQYRQQQRELSAHPSYTAYLAWQGLVRQQEDLTKQIERAQWVIADWSEHKAGRRWQKENSAAWMAYYDDQQAAEHIAPDLIKKGQSKLPNIQRKLAEMADQLPQLTELKRIVDEVEQSYKEQKATLYRETANQRWQYWTKINDVRANARDTVAQLLAGYGFDLADHHSQPLQKPGPLPTYSSLYRHTYEARIGSMTRTAQVVAAEQNNISTQPIGWRHPIQRKRQKAAVARIQSPLGHLEHALAPDNTDDAHQLAIDYRARAGTYTAIAALYNEYLAAYESD